MLPQNANVVLLDTDRPHLELLLSPSGESGSCLRSRRGNCSSLPGPSTMPTHAAVQSVHEPDTRLPPRVLRPRLHSEALPASVTFAYHSASLPLRASAFWAGLSSASSLDRSSSSICGVSHPYHSPNPNSRNRPQPARPIYLSIKLYIHTYLVTPTGIFRRPPPHIENPNSAPKRCLPKPRAS